MPWCPVCHAEYREGVKVCRQCQAELVGTPPAAGEQYEPPAQSVLDTVAEALTQRARARGWGQQLGQGFRLFGESFRLMLRMRNLWLLLAVLTALATIGVLRPPQHIDSVVLDLSILRRSASIGSRVVAGWRDPLTAINHVCSDVRTGLSTPFGYVTWLYGWVYLRMAKDEAAVPHWYTPMMLGGGLAVAIIETLFMAGIMWWMLGTVRGEAQTVARFWRGVRRSFWPLLAWVLVYTIAYEALYTLAFGRGGPAVLREAFSALLALAFLPLMFTAKVIVIRRPPLYWAPVDSARIFAKNLLVILGFAIPFIVLHDLVWAVDSGLRYHYYSVWDPQYAYRHAMPALALVMQALKVAVELLITTAGIILVARWKEVDEAEPAQPEAASA